MTEPIKVVIADDHRMFIDGVISLLKKEKNISFVFEALNGEDALHYIRHNPVDLLITDISMPEMSGTELTRKVKLEFPQLKILVLTMFNDAAIIKDILQSEAEGYILKNTGRQELVGAITKIMDNGTYYSNEVINQLLIQKKKDSSPPAKNTTLTTRELEILKLVCEEYTTAQIAEKLFISPRTVDTHRKNILEKTGVKTIIGLIKYAYENNLLSA